MTEDRQPAQSLQNATPGVAPSEPPAWERTLRLRRALVRGLVPPPLAWSVDGRAFGMRGPVDHPVVPGDFVLLTQGDGVPMLGQLLDKAIEESDGPRVALDTEAMVRPEAAAIAGVSVPVRVRTCVGGGVVLGVIKDGTVGAEGARPFDEALVEPAPPEIVAAYLADLDAGRPTSVVGAARTHDQSLPARVRLDGFNRHTFVCGQSGSGKTFALGVLLERLVIGTTLRVVVIDPNGDFVRIHTLRSPDEVDRTRRLAASPDEYGAFAARHATATERMTIHTAHPDHPIPTVRLTDLSPQAQAAVLQLDPLRDREEYAEVVEVVRKARKAREERGGDVRTVLAQAPDALSHELGLRIANLGVATWSVWAGSRPTLTDAMAAEHSITVADLGALATDAERQVATISILEDLWDRRAERVPTLIVIDEAHNVAPRHTQALLQQMSRDLLIRIAGEGRKFGLFMVVATQRPDKMHPDVVGQCDNLVLMRMNAQADVDELVRTFSFVPESLLRLSPTFAQGEAILAGRIVGGPTRVRFGGRYTHEGGADLATDWAVETP